MEQDVLAEVIEVEKAIQLCLEREQAASREWLEQIRREIEGWSREEERATQERVQGPLEQARKEAAETASDAEKLTAALEGRLDELSDDDLSRIAVKRISRIIMD